MGALVRRWIGSERAFACRGAWTRLWRTANRCTALTKPGTPGAAFLGTLVYLAAGAALAQVNVTTYHNDNLRTGWNPNETVLTRSNLSDFGLLQTVSLDDQVDAEPLIVSNEMISGVQHNVVYVATENNSVYAIDAQSGAVLLQTNLGLPVLSPLGCINNGPNVGINSTPVIDTSTGALYVIAYVLQNGITPTYYLHALSLTTLSDLNAPVQISASASLKGGRTYQFNAGVSRQRPALLLANGNIYAGFGSFCDFADNQSRGWVLGWQESTLSPLPANKLNNRLASSPDDFFLTSVWMSGYGLAANSAGSVFFVTGNSDNSGTTLSHKNNITESAAKMSGDLSTQQGLFTPSNWSLLDEEDNDFGSGGLMLLPTQPGKFPNLAAAAGKDGNMYILDADKLKKNIATPNIGGCWCGPSYYQDSAGDGRIVASGANSVTVLVNKGTSKPDFVQTSQFNGIANAQNPGFFTSVSSNGTMAGTAVVWAVGRPTSSYPAYVTLYAVNPDNGNLLFSSQAGQWLNTGGNSNIVPMVANGLVYVAADQTLEIFGTGANGGVMHPNIRAVDIRLPLKPGEHEVYGTVESLSDSSIVVKKRGGEILRINPVAARLGHNYATPKIGRALIARGSYDKAGVLVAERILHAVSHPAMWPSDR